MLKKIELDKLSLPHVIPLYGRSLHLQKEEGVNGVNRLATKGEKILLTTDKTWKKLPTSDKNINRDLPTTDKDRKF